LKERDEYLEKVKLGKGHNLGIAPFKLSLSNARFFADFKNCQSGL